jgi:hypothetical protein
MLAAILVANDLNVGLETAQALLNNHSIVPLNIFVLPHNCSNFLTSLSNEFNTDNV